MTEALRAGFRTTNEPRVSCRLSAAVLARSSATRFLRESRPRHFVRDGRSRVLLPFHRPIVRHVQSKLDSNLMQSNLNRASSVRPESETQGAAIPPHLEGEPRRAAGPSRAGGPRRAGGGAGRRCYDNEEDEFIRLDMCVADMSSSAGWVKLCLLYKDRSRVRTRARICLRPGPSRPRPRCRLPAPPRPARCVCEAWWSDGRRRRRA